jgi:hypothetical protein
MAACLGNFGRGGVVGFAVFRQCEGNEYVTKAVKK